MTRIYVDMVADLFHAGHVEFLRKARALGDELVVGIHSDDTVARYKRRPLMSMEERIKIVEACRYVDEVVPNAPLEVPGEYLDRLRIDLVVHGDDLPDETRRTMYGVAEDRGILRLVPYTHGISTSDLLERLRARLAADEATRPA
jgi:cytidyltransferase-like protein